MVYPLELIQTLIEVSFATAARPEQIPLMGLSVSESICLTETPDQLGVSLQYFVEKLAVVDMVASSSFALVVPIGRSWGRILQQLGHFNRLKINIFIYTTLDFILIGRSILEKRSLSNVKRPILVEKVLSCPRLAILTT